MKQNHLEHSVTASCPAFFPNSPHYTVFPFQNRPSFIPVWSRSGNPTQAFPPAEGRVMSQAGPLKYSSAQQNNGSSDLNPAESLGLSCDSFTTTKEYPFDSMLWSLFVINDFYKTPEPKSKQFSRATGSTQTTTQVKSNPLLFSLTVSPQCHSLPRDINYAKATHFSLLSKE